MGAPVLSIIVPCFNEDEVLPETARRLGGFKLSCNRGHQNALMAGLLAVRWSPSMRTPSLLPHRGHAGRLSGWQMDGSFGR